MYISRSCGGATFCPIQIKFGVFVNLVDIIICAKFYSDRIKGFDPPGGQSSCFPFTEVYVLNSLPPYWACK